MKGTDTEFALELRTKDAFSNLMEKRICCQCLCNPCPKECGKKEWFIKWSELRKEFGTEMFT